MGYFLGYYFLNKLTLTNLTLLRFCILHHHNPFQLLVYVVYLKDSGFVILVRFLYVSANIKFYQILPDTKNSITSILSIQPPEFHIIEP